MTRGYVPENSSDLSSGRRPLSKSDEFSGTYPLVIEIMRETAKIKCYPLSEHHSTVTLARASEATRGRQRAGSVGGVGGFGRVCNGLGPLTAYRSESQVFLFSVQFVSAVCV